MKASKYFLPTLRETPADAEVVSHRLLLRGGFVRKLAAGVYSYLPLGHRVHEKVAQIVREEMDSIGGLEFHLPVLVPKELLEETGRDKVDVLFPLDDRNKRSFFLGFTHEEVITDIVRGSVSSWKQLPLILYQIQTKFRDEARPRAGLLRSREFTMKDAYSFDFDHAGLDKSFDLHKQAYGRIFDRCGLAYVIVNADSGAIGGSESNEFMVLADSGEDTVLRCNLCGYAANAERAEIGQTAMTAVSSPLATSPALVNTPGAHTVAQVCEFLNIASEQLIKTIIVTCNGTASAALIRGDRELQLQKLGRILEGVVELADSATVEQVSGAPVGFAGPIGLKGIRVIVDHELNIGVDWVVGANQKDAHFTGVSLHRDCPGIEWGDIRLAIEGDPCGNGICEGAYSTAYGIEVGHIFKLGTKYSHDMKAQVQTDSGQSIDMIMGCYGLGISRTIASAIEAHHDSDGIKWPITIAPFQVVLIIVNPNDSNQMAAAEKLHCDMETAGIDVLFDDRTDRSGVKFKDADLIGYPIKIVVGRSLAQGQVEVSLRRDKSTVHTPGVDGAVEFVLNLIQSEFSLLTR